MPTLKTLFTGGKMNLDADERLLEKGQYRTASNIRIANSSGGNVGAIEKSLSNKQLSNLYLGANVKTIGGISDEFEEKLYWLVTSDLGSFIVEHNIKLGTSYFVLKDTREENVLNFNEDYLVTGIVLVIDTDNNNRFLIFTDGNTQPKCINIERAKGYGENGFEEEEILLIKKPPLDAPKITLSKTASQEENNIEEKFLIFFSRFKYLDGEYSAFSPASEVAFKAKLFKYDFATSTNESMINQFNEINIEVNTGSKLVTEIEVIFKESQHNTLYLVEKYNKTEKGWGNDVLEMINFSNNKIYKSISESQLYRLFDGVPLKAKALEIINNIIVFGNYTENWNLIDAANSPINLKMDLNVVSSETTTRSSYESNKSNRDYEVGLVYGDGYGRHTTVLTSEGNTVHVPSNLCSKKNQLTLNISEQSKPPKFAEWFRVYVKQNRYDYDSIIPSVFYTEGNFVWVKLESADIDKIKVGDFIYVKSDSEGIVQKTIQTRIIEIEKKERNFLEVNETEEFKQQQGIYYKIKPTNFRLNVADLEVTESNFRLKNLRLPSEARIAVTYQSIYYGSEIEETLTPSNNLYTGDTDERYIVEIDRIADDVSYFVDTYKWRKGDGSAIASNVEITEDILQGLDDGVQVLFNNEKGYEIGDKWVISAKTSNTSVAWSDAGHAYGFFPSTPDDIIKGNASIEIKYKEDNDINQEIEFPPFISSRRYESLEEWFYEDGIEQVFNDEGINSHRIIFRRGIVSDTTGINFTTDGTGTTIMIIRSLGVDNNFIDKDPRVEATIKISQSGTDSNIIFETKSKDLNSDIFYEIGRTYPIDNGFHTSVFPGDINQTESTNLEITLPHYNCFAWGNGFESIKIKDLFNSDSYKFETRPNAPIENFGENNKIASLTYSQPYSQSLNYNGLNEFNLSKNNSKDLDDKFGSIQAVKEYNGNLDVYQEDKISRVLFGKTVLYNQDGSSNIAKSDLILDGVQPYSGEFGISKNPESLASFGNYRYWADKKRGNILRNSQSGIEIISNFGMKDWFRDNLHLSKRILGGIDPQNDQYTISLEIEDPVIKNNINCENEINIFNISEEYIYYLQLNNLFGDIVLSYNITSGTANINALYNGETNEELNISGSGTLTFTRDSFTDTEVRVTITPVTNYITYNISNACPIGLSSRIRHIVLSSIGDYATNIIHKYLRGNSSFFTENIYFDSNLVKIKSYEGIEGLTRFPIDGETIEIQSYKNSSRTGEFNAEIGDRLGYFVSNSEINVNDVIQNATFPEVITLNQGSQVQTNKISFTYNKTTNNSILYLIWDYSKSNLPPVAIDDSVNLISGEIVVIPVTNNDTDPENDVLTPIVIRYPQYGTVTINPDNTITYTHDNSVNLTDSFTYKVTDGTDESNAATVSLYIEAANLPPVAIDDTVSVYKGQTVIISVLSNDTDPDGDVLIPTIVTNPQYGSVVLNSNGTISYTHNNSAESLDSFTYYVSDGNLNSNIANVNIGIGLAAGGSISTSGDEGVYLVPLIIGTEAGELIAHFNAQSVPDRFQILFDISGVSNNLADMEIVADSLFVGDAIVSDTSPFNNPVNETISSLDLHLFDGSTFNKTEIGTQSIVMTDSVVVSNQGSRSNATPNGVSRNSSGATQFGIQNKVYVNNADTVGTEGLNYADGNIALKYNKTTTTSFRAYLRIYGLGNTAWDLFQTEFIK